MPPFQVRCSGMLSFPFDLLPCRKGNLKILLSKARKARMSDKDTSCYIYTPHGDTHSDNTQHSHTPFSFFPAIPTTEHGEQSRVRAEKTAQRSCSGFFQIRTCEALDGFGVWSYLCRLKREKTQFASLTLTGQRIPCSDMIFLRIDTLTVEKSDLS